MRNGVGAKAASDRIFQCPAVLLDQQDIGGMDIKQGGDLIEDDGEGDAQVEAGADRRIDGAQGCQPLELAFHLFLGMFVLPPFLRLAKLSLDGGRQACQVAFQKVVVRSRFHGGHSKLFTDGSGEDDEGNVDALFLKQL